MGAAAGRTDLDIVAGEDADPAVVFTLVPVVIDLSYQVHDVALPERQLPARKSFFCDKNCPFLCGGTCNCFLSENLELSGVRFRMTTSDFGAPAPPTTRVSHLGF